MKTCPKCNNSHIKPGTFCSRKCANSRIFSEEAKLKKSLALKGKPSNRGESYNKELQAQKSKETWRLKRLSSPIESLGHDARRKIVVEEQNYCCAKCGISEWFGKKITLELEHKDGNNKNNVRENLEGLCPNCHSITETWRGRNKNQNDVVVSDNVLLQCLRESKNIHQALIKAGMTPKGKNYQRARELLST